MNKIIIISMALFFASLMHITDKVNGHKQPTKVICVNKISV